MRLCFQGFLYPGAGAARKSRRRAPARAANRKGRGLCLPLLTACYTNLAQSAVPLRVQCAAAYSWQVMPFICAAGCSRPRVPGPRRIVAAASSGVLRARWVSLPGCLSRRLQKASDPSTPQNQALCAHPKQHKRRGSRPARVLARTHGLSPSPPREMRILKKAPPYLSPVPLCRTVYTPSQPAASAAAAAGYYCLRVCVFTRAHAPSALWRNIPNVCRLPCQLVYAGAVFIVSGGAVVSRMLSVLNARAGGLCQEHGTPVRLMSRV